jgi:rubredoxin
MKYINPARKVIADGKRALAKIELTFQCPRCPFRRKKKLVRLQRDDLYCPACGAKLKREKLFGEPGSPV